MRPLLVTVCLLPIGSIVAAEPSWVDFRQIGSFRIQAEFALNRYATTLRDLDRLPADLHRRLGLTPQNRPVEVLLFRSASRFRNEVKRRIPGAAQRRAVYVKGPDRSWVFAYRHAGWEADLLHEATHALLHNAVAFLPLWLDEGLAEYFEQPAGRRAAGHPHAKRLMRRVRGDWNPSLESLERKNTLAEFSKKNYRESWAWVHFLLHGPEPARKALAGYLGSIERGTPPGAFSRYLSARMVRPRQAMLDHLRTSTRR